MKIIVSIFLLLLVCKEIIAQEKPKHHFCASDLMQNNLFYNHPEQKQKLLAIEDAILERMLSGKQNLDKSILTIPVVVHIVHNNGSENITDGQVQQAIQYLNEAYGNTGSYQRPDGTDTEIRFCLAKQDPSGAATTGITRTISTLTDMTMETEDLALKNLVRWDPLRYLNIWVIKEIRSQSMGTGVLGYAYFPSSHGNSEDGIVNESGWFGQSAGETAVTVHEVGHYLGLYHTFQDGCPNNSCLVDGDKVCDTPPDNSTSPINCSTGINTCTSDDDDLSASNPLRPVANGGLGDINDLTLNYMDYGEITCFTLLTAGQKTRMRDALINTRNSLLSSDGCNDPCLNPIVAGFTSSANVIIDGTNVTFNATAPTGTSLLWEIGSNNLGNANTAAFTFNTQGTYIVSLTLSNSDPNCQLILKDTIFVSCSAAASFTASNKNPKTGENISFTNTSASTGLTFQWFVDGIAQATTRDWNTSFPDAGGHQVYLVAYNGICSDTSAFTYILVGACKSKEADIWYFGKNAGLDFSSGQPIAISDGVINTSEGCATISNQNGNLLFYTDGITIWNKNHVPMQNGTGLLGNPSSTQSAIIVKDPGNSNLFYVIAADAYGSTNGLTYSVVDITADSGLGAVTNIKNVLLSPNVIEKVTMVNHKNGCDLWVISHEKNTNQFLAYLITVSGIASTPVISSVGTAYSDELGYLKASPNGLLLVSAMYFGGYFEFFDFDNQTGILSNVRYEEEPDAYGAEFSPDNSKLYIASYTGRLLQLDLNVTPFAKYYEDFAGYLGALQIGPDGKIYLCSNVSNALSVIHNPNGLGVLMNLSKNSINLSVGAISSLGLPAFPQSYFQDPIPRIEGRDTVCLGSSYVYNLSNPSCKDSTAIWGIIGNAALSNATDNEVTVTFNESGFYKLYDTKYTECGMTSDTFLIYVTNGIKPDLGADTSFCAASIVLSPTPAFENYSWQDGSELPTFATGSPGTYWVEVTDQYGCKNRDSIDLFPYSGTIDLDLGNDTSICLGVNLHLDAGANPGDTYLWQDLSSNPSYTVYTPGKYWLTVTDNCGLEATDTIVINELKKNLIDFGADTSVCDQYILDAGSPFISYIWQDQSADQTYTTNSDGTYWVTVTEASGCFDSDTISLIFLYSPSVYLGEDTLFCSGETPILLSAPFPGYTYLWQDGSNLATMLVTQPGIYSVEVSNSCKTVFDAIEFDCPLVIPDFFTPQNDGINDVFFITGIENEVWEFTVLNRWGNVVYQNEKYQNDWNAQGLSAGVYFYRLSNKIMDKHYEGYLHIFK